MLKKHSKLFENILFIIDIAVISLSWLASYYIRFHSGFVEVTKGIPDFFEYLLLLVPIIVIWAFAFRAFGLYRPKRISTHISEVLDIAKACVIAALLLVALTFFIRKYDFSRLVFIFFTVINIVLLSAGRGAFREALRLMRKKGYNLRYAVVVGTGQTAKELISRLDRHPEIGIKVIGAVSANGQPVASPGIPVIGQIGGLREIIRARGVDNVFIALSWDEHSKVLDAIQNIGDEAVDIQVIPDIYEFITLRGGIEEFDGLPILNLRESPLYGWNIVLKRLADVAFASLAIIILSPVMLFIAVLVKLSSKGPVFYSQERMSIGGDTFRMLKFRSMGTDAEKDTGAVWARENDARRTRIGAILRKTSLDELPQFFNVLKGDMSLVGPRPERPVFISRFRKDIPKYMLRHKMKAGITGWAQVNGWRGNTDLTKRLEHDIYYIENWSLMLDLKILILTLWKGLVNRNAY